MDAAKDVLVLNGLPRNPAQARGLAGMGIDVPVVILLDCSVETAWQRKARSERGMGFEDRSHRADVSREVFDRKARSFVEETAPLMDWYRDRGTQVLRVAVGSLRLPPALVADGVNPAEQIVLSLGAPILAIAPKASPPV